MGYQALLFCPDEKTARTVTQVLSELDFAVIPCTEPFAAVKKLMGEHFDAVVVDCDNEQNATLLFKSARNSPNNHSSLAVAVVEGQAGVAKAFRIGANLVLTKPVNVEQAKGTLRVARGLLRKSEAAKTVTGAASAAARPAPPVPAPPKPGPQRIIPTVSTAGAAAPITPSVAAAAASSSTQKLAPQAKIVASVPSKISKTDSKLFEAGSEEGALPPSASEAKIAASQPGIASPTAGHLPKLGWVGTGAASAPAPAREPKTSAATEGKASTVISEPVSPVENVAAAGNSFSVEETSVRATSFTLGGNVGAESGGRKKALLAVAAIVLVAAVGYEVWLQWERSGGAETAPLFSQPVRTTVKVPQAAPNTAPSAPASAAPLSVPSSTAATPETNTRATVSSESVQSHQTKAGSGASSGAESSTHPVSAVAENKAPSTGIERPLVVKNHPAQAGAGRPAPDVTAPSIAGIATGNSSSLPDLIGSSNAATPVLQDLHVSQGVSRGLLVKEVQPAYPASARQMRIEGAVDLLATISKNGDISAVKVLDGNAQLAHAAVDAVKQWKYKPYLLNGEPVEIQTQVTVKFKLPR